jgi:hypothetical protein
MSAKNSKSGSGILDSGISNLRHRHHTPIYIHFQFTKHTVKIPAYVTLEHVADEMVAIIESLENPFSVIETRNKIESWLQSVQVSEVIPTASVFIRELLLSTASLPIKLSVQRDDNQVIIRAILKESLFFGNTFKDVCTINCNSSNPY